MFEFIKGLFKSSPMDKAFQHCLEADEALMKKVMMFYYSYKAVGIELLADTSSFDKLEEILKSCIPDTRELTLDAVSAFLGCIIREQLGEKWVKTGESKYKITGIGKNRLTVEVAKDLFVPLAEERRPSIKKLYETITCAAISQ